MSYTLSIYSFIVEYHGNLRLFGIKSRYFKLDAQKAKQWFLEHEPLFALFLKTEELSFPKNLPQLLALLHLIVYRGIHERFVNEKPAVLRDYLKRYPLVLEYYLNLAQQKRLHPYLKDYPEILERTEAHNLKKDEWVVRLAPRIFTFDLARKMMAQDLFSLIDYAFVEKKYEPKVKAKTTLKSLFRAGLSFIRSCFVSFY